MQPRSGLAARRHARVFAALGDGTRLALVMRLSDQSPLSIARLTEGTSLTRQAVSKHLVVLRRAGLIRAVRSGRERLIELRPRPLDEARDRLNKIGRQWEAALGRLKRFVEP
jgi:DNA-binding transcriptional ArsR family regulator